MKRLIILAAGVSLLLVCVYGAITMADYNMRYGRMWETPGVKPHEHPIPRMADGLVPAAGGEMLYRAVPGDHLAPPKELNRPHVIEQGKKGYFVYCVHCHGKYHDGNGTVGQSFSPLPGDLRSKRIQKLPAGRMFKEISFGVPGGRQPPLAATVAAEERWDIIAYVKSLGLRQSPAP